ncbi:class I SAM-dependent methyltransferase [Paenibacillus lemnae]|uniref:Methyltransferase domain-containing protein n=1 Tax=Paenibacillus lemnae TaxID=1330551 RepID=A0A848M657_PAELE|nr:class I SAM-dependent methyltransferase [Paenibacillus lemnae]NMO96096.1 methyltransferase domain-containing protein [Paenibacillus lemnae]
MGFLSVLSFAHKLVTERLAPGGIAIDATAGTGADTLFLAQKAGRSGKVFAFDIQEQALSITQERLAKAGTEPLAEVKLVHSSHAGMNDIIPASVHGKISAIMFNLGYLPAEGADKELITSPASTLPALDTALELLAPGGVITIVVYPGHPGGDQEARAVEEWCSSLSPLQAQTVMYRGLQRSEAPYLIAIERKKPL